MLRGFWARLLRFAALPITQRGGCARARRNGLAGTAASILENQLRYCSARPIARIEARHRWVAPRRRLYRHRAAPSCWESRMLDWRPAARLERSRLRLQWA